MKKLFFLIILLFALPKAYCANSISGTPPAPAGTAAGGNYKNGDVFSVTYSANFPVGILGTYTRIDVLYDNTELELVNPNAITGTGVFLAPTVLSGMNTGYRYITLPYGADDYDGATTFTLNFKVISTQCGLHIKGVQVELSTMFGSAATDLRFVTSSVTIDNALAVPTISMTLMSGNPSLGTALYRIVTAGPTSGVLGYHGIYLSLPAGVTVTEVRNSAAAPVATYPLSVSGFFLTGAVPCIPIDATQLIFWSRETFPGLQVHYVLVNFSSIVGTTNCTGGLCASFVSPTLCTGVNYVATAAPLATFDVCTIPTPGPGWNYIPVGDGHLYISKTFETVNSYQYFCAPNNCKEHDYIIQVDNLSGTDVADFKVEDFLASINATAGSEGILVTGIDVSLTPIISGLPTETFSLNPTDMSSIGITPLVSSIASNGNWVSVYGNNPATGIWLGASNPASWGLGTTGSSILKSLYTLRIRVRHKLNVCPASPTDPYINKATVTVGTLPPADVTVTTVQGNADIAIIGYEKKVKRVAGGPFNTNITAAPGELVEFRITIKNYGRAAGSANISDIVSESCPKYLTPVGGFTVVDNTLNGSTPEPVYLGTALADITAALNFGTNADWSTSTPIVIEASSSCDAISTLVITYQALVPTDPCCGLVFTNNVTLTDLSGALIDAMRTATVSVDRFKYIEMKLEATCDTSLENSWVTGAINARPGQYIYYRAYIRNNNNYPMSGLKMMVQLPAGVVNMSSHNSSPSLDLLSTISPSGVGFTGPIGAVTSVPSLPAPYALTTLGNNFLSQLSATSTNPGDALYAEGIGLTPRVGFTPGGEYIIRYTILTPLFSSYGTQYNTALGVGLEAGSSCPFAAATNLNLTLAEYSSCDSGAPGGPCVCDITGDSIICEGSSFTMSGCDSGYWVSTDTLVATVDLTTGVVIGQGEGIAIISYISMGGCTSTFMLTVNPTPPVPSGTTTICAGTTTTLSDVVPGGIWSSEVSDCASVNPVTGIVTGLIAPCTTTITYTMPSGCFSTITVDVTICDSCCGDSLIISTGYNPLTRTIITPGTDGGTPVTDPYWIITSMTQGIFNGMVRTSDIPVTPGFGAGMPSIINNADVLSPPSYYAGIVNPSGWPSKWISCLNNSLGYRTLLSSSGETYIMTMTRIFDMCAPDSVLINVGVVSDNTVLSTNIDGIDLSFSGASSTSSFTNLTRAIYLGAGRHELNFVVRNSYASFIMYNNTTGLNVYGTITSLTGTHSLNTEHDTICNKPSGCACIITGDSVLCSGTTTTLSGCDSGLWSSSNSLVASVGPLSGIVTAGIAGTAIITYNSPAGCISLFTVTVIPSPAAITGSTVVCLGTTTTLTDATPGGIWSSSNTGCGTVSPYTGMVTGITAPCTTVITYMLASGCYSTVVVSVNPVPHMCSMMVCSVCSGTLFSYIPNSTILGATFAWSRAAVPGISNPSASGTGNPNEVLINTTGSPIVVTYAYTVTAGGCSSTANVTVTVLPGLTSTYTVTGGGGYCPDAVCPTVGLNNTTAGITYQLFCANTYTGVYSIGTGSAISFGSQCGPCIYKVVALNTTTGCTDTMTGSVSAAPYPACPISGSTTLCVGNSSTLTACPGGTWISSATTVGSIGSSSGVVTAISAGVTTIQYTSPDGCITTIDVTVNDFPATPVISGIDMVCLGSSTALTATPAPGTWMLFGTNHGTLSPGNPYVGSGVTFTGTSLGVQQIFYMYSNCCGTSLASINVTVGVMPPISGPDTVCDGNSIVLTDSVAGGSWTVSSTLLATIDSTGTVTAHGTGMVTVTYLLPSGCFAIKTVYIVDCPCSFMCSNGDFEAPTGSGQRHLAEDSLSPCWRTTETGHTIELWRGVTGIAAAHGTQFCEINSNVASSTVYTEFTGVPGSTVTIRFAHRGRYTLPDVMSVHFEQSIGGVFTTPTYPGVSAGATQIGLTGYSENYSGGWKYYSINYTLPISGGPSRLFFHSVSTGEAGAVGGNWLDDVSVNLAIDPITGPDELCEGADVNEYNADTCGSWSSSNTDVATVNAVTGVVHGVTAGTFTLTFTNCNGCITTKVMTVNPSSGIIIIGTSVVCVGSTTVLTDASASGGTWTSANPAVATIGSATGIVTGISPGTVTITYAGYSPCGPIWATVIVTVSSTIAPITGPDQVCVGSSIMLADATTCGSWSSSDETIATVNSGTGSVTGVMAGTVTITYTNCDGCIVTKTITVNPSPVMTGPYTVCLGQSINMGDDSAYCTAWSSSNPAVASVNPSNGLVHGNSVGTAIITVTNCSGCSAIHTVTVNPAPPVCTLSGGGSTCLGACPDIYLSCSTPGVNYQVYSGSTAVGVPVPGTGLTLAFGGQCTPGIYTAMATNPTTGCTSTMTGSVAVTTCTTCPTCPIYGTATLCVGQSIPLMDSCAGGTWTSSSTSVALIGLTTGVVTGISAGTTNITYATSPTCFTVMQVTVSAVAATISGTFSLCTGAMTTLSATGSGSWSSSNTTRATINMSTGELSGISAGTVTITYTTGIGCFSVVAVTVNNTPAPIGGLDSVCPGLSSSLTASPTGGTWTSGNTSVAAVGSATGIATGLTTGTTSITYTLANGCAVKRNFTVNANPSAIGGTLATCISASVSLSASPSGGSWTSSNTSVATVHASSGVATGVNAGTTRITYTIGTGCYSIATFTVNATPGAITGITTLCTGSTSALGSATTGGAWSTDDAGVADVNETTGMVTGIGTGTTMISYSNGSCAVSTTVSVSTGTTAITGLTVVCIGQATSLANATSGGTWSSSLTSVATVHASTGLVTGISAGTATITYRISAGCFTMTTVTVNAALGTIAGTLAVCPGATTTLSHSVAGGNWTSSNTTKATINMTTGVATGISPGTTTITYSIGTGCFRTGTLTVNSTPASVNGTAAICNGASTTLTCATGGGTWSSADAGVATVVSGVVTGHTAGTVTISYTTSCASVKIVTVNTAPAPISGSPSVCVGTTTLLTTTPAGGYWNSNNTYRATVGSGTGMVTGMNAGTANITYTISGGCFSVLNVSVSTMPSVITGPLVLCTGGTVTLGSATTGGNWMSGNTSVASVGSNTGVVVGVGSGTSAISYTLGSCSRTAIVTVNAAGGTISGDASVCVGQTNATLSTGLSGGTWSSSASGIANVHAATGLLTGVSVGNASITYTFSPGCFITRTATVNSSVSPITGPTTVAVGSSTTLSNATAGGTWSSSNTYKATVVSSSGVVSGIAAGTTTITYMVSAGCYTYRPETVTSSKMALADNTGGSGAFSIYPNPTAGSLIIAAPVAGKCVIYTIDGKLIVEYAVLSNPTSISLPVDLAAGVYMCRFLGNDGSMEMMRIVYER